MRAGTASDDHMRVLGAEPGSVGEAALERGEADRVERHRVRSATEPHLLVAVLTLLTVSGRSSLTDAACSSARSPTSASCGWQSTGRPASEQPGLVCSGESAAAEPAGGSVRETRGRVGEADPLLAGEAEEVAQRRQPEAAIATRGEELPRCDRASTSPSR